MNVSYRYQYNNTTTYLQTVLQVGSREDSSEKYAVCFHYGCKFHASQQSGCKMITGTGKNEKGFFKREQINDTI